MQIVVAQPPLIEEIDAAFDVRGKPVIFCFGDRIYNPHGVKVGPELMAHEGVHSQRQGTKDSDVTAWWRRYIADAAFRLAEEIPAHQAEYRAACASIRDRNKQARVAHQIARRLASPLYGGVISFPQAMEWMRAA